MSKIAFITGASSGIGAACARKFAQGGYTLLLNARSEDKLQALKTELETTYGTDILLLPFDVRDRKAAEEPQSSPLAVMNTPSFSLQRLPRKSQVATAVLRTLAIS